eukprot:scaffold1483_cov374-Pavlova_lutheri.AAC.20
MWFYWCHHFHLSSPWSPKASRPLPEEQHRWPGSGLLGAGLPFLRVIQAQVPAHEDRLVGLRSPLRPVLPAEVVPGPPRVHPHELLDASTPHCRKG